MSAPEVVLLWTGHHANALRLASRMTLDQFAEVLGMSKRAVSGWSSGKADVVLRPDTQAILDEGYERASDAVKARFALFVEQSPAGESVARRQARRERRAAQAEMEQPGLRLLKGAG